MNVKFLAVILGVLAIVACGTSDEPTGGSDSNLNAEHGSAASTNEVQCGASEKLVTARFDTLSACVSSRPHQCKCDCLSQGPTVLLACCCPGAPASAPDAGAASSE